MIASRAVIVGAGHAGFSVASSLRSTGFAGTVTLVGDEHGLPYQRPPLSKELLKRETSAGDVAFRPARFYSDKEIDLVTGDGAASIQRERCWVTLHSGRELPYDVLILATGAVARRLPLPGGDLGNVVALRSLTDAVALGDRLAEARQMVVIGGGFIGLEVAAAARSRGVAVTVLEALDRTLARVVTPTISAYICAKHQAHGTEVRHGAAVRRIVGDTAGAASAVELEDGERIAADIVVIGVGAVPNTALARDAGLDCANGIVVDEYLATSDPRIHAIGDCASFLGADRRRRRLESVQNANDHGRAVAATISGSPRPYTATAWFWTYQHDCRLQIAGLTDAADSTVLRGDPKTGSFSVFCFAGDQFVGAESVNAPRDHLAVRKVLDAGVPLLPKQAADVTYPLKPTLAKGSG